MRRAALTVGAVAVLAGCGRLGAATPTAGATIVKVSADVARCTDAGFARTCTVPVTYTNESQQVAALGVASTLLVDSVGDVHSGVSDPSLLTPRPLEPGEEVAMVWTVTLDSSATIDFVSFADQSGSTQSVPVRTLLQSPTTTPSSGGTPSSVVQPAPSVAPSASRTATPKPSRTRTQQPRPTSSGPPATGSIG